MSTEEPQMARFLKSKVMIKDYHYYKKQDNAWNNPAQMDPKLYKQYQKHQDEAKPIIEQRIQQGIQDNVQREHIHIQQLLNKRDEDFDRYSSRLEERALVQDKSKQRYKSVGIEESFDKDEEFSHYLAKKQNSSRYLRQNENTWNQLNNLSKKYIKQYLTPHVVKGEENMVEGVRRAIAHENHEAEIEKKKIDEMRRNIRDTLQQKRAQNGQFLRQIGIELQKPEYSESTPASKVWDFLSGVESNNEQKPLEFDEHSVSNSNRSGVETKSRVTTINKNPSYSKFGSDRSLLGPDIDRLSIPKQVNENLYSLLLTIN